MCTGPPAAGTQSAPAPRRWRPRRPRRPPLAEASVALAPRRGDGGAHGGGGAHVASLRAKATPTGGVWVSVSLVFALDPHQIDHAAPPTGDVEGDGDGRRARWRPSRRGVVASATKRMQPLVRPSPVPAAPRGSGPRSRADWGESVKPLGGDRAAPGAGRPLELHRHGAPVGAGVLQRDRALVGLAGWASCTSTRTGETHEAVRSRPAPRLGERAQPGHSKQGQGQRGGAHRGPGTPGRVLGLAAFWLSATAVMVTVLVVGACGERNCVEALGTVSCQRGSCVAGAAARSSC